VTTPESRSRRDVPPGSRGAPAIFAGVRERAAGSFAASGRSRAALYFGAYAEWYFGELWISAVSEVAAKLAHIFQYALQAPLGDDLHGPLTEFLSDGISLLETSLLEISEAGQENVEDVAAFKERYRFAFPPEPPPLNLGMPATAPLSQAPSGLSGRAGTSERRTDRVVFRRAPGGR